MLQSTSSNLCLIPFWNITQDYSWQTQHFQPLEGILGMCVPFRSLRFERAWEGPSHHAECARTVEAAEIMLAQMGPAECCMISIGVVYVDPKTLWKCEDFWWPVRMFRYPKIDLPSLWYHPSAVLGGFKVALIELWSKTDRSIEHGRFFYVEQPAWREYNYAKMLTFEHFNIRNRIFQWFRIRAESKHPFWFVK